MRLRRTMAAIAVTTMSMAGMATMTAPASAATAGCKGTRLAKVPVRGGQTPAVVGYLEVYARSRMMCARTMAYNSQGTQWMSVRLNDGLNNKRDTCCGSPSPTDAEWKVGWDAVDSGRYSSYAGPAMDYDNGTVIVHGYIKKYGIMYTARWVG
ncbi:hypothetical protein [Nonomuraea basaltis]|uniref:hypothetical protein n=1 Tax=Nonomuraea basaltis TaxID=2495887 RepID=UPI00110C4435|nr:hypothetical protein [Nonomuraea basaltis]TMR91889.1 hypothetical protein EJK15_47555 [Nonomuraea basaltis]